jgi:DNA-binding GntR family transcriptional regulator
MSAVMQQDEAQPTTLNEEAYRRLEEMIVTLQLAPGSVVSEAILGRQMGMGTTPIREALQRLSREYLVQVLPRRGVVVTAVDLRQQLQVLETRRELDRLVVRAAARRASAAERELIRDLAAELRSTGQEGDLLGFLRTDAGMKLAIARASHNQVAAAAASPLHAVSRRFWYFHGREAASLLETAKWHIDVANAVAAGDEAQAVAANEALIGHLISFARSTIPELDSPG